MKTLRCIILAAWIAAATLPTGCGGARTAVSDADTLYAPRYAKGFEVLGCGESSILVVRNPWQGAHDVERRIFLARGGQPPPDGFVGEVVRTPVRRTVCMSSSYVAFLDALGCVDVVSGVSGARFITHPVVRERVARGQIPDVGYDSAINYELVAALDPDVLFTFGVESENTMMSGKMRELSVPVVYVGEYLEESPLGRAEWIVFFGELMGCREEAERIFDRIAGRYERLRDSVAAQTTDRPVVMLNAPWRDVWYTPGDRSYMVRLIRDACGAYAYAGHDTERSLPISVETAFVHASAADYWLNPGQVATVAELIALNPRFSKIGPVTAGRVYNCTRHATPEGGSDFWESGVVRPDVALADLVRILHPESMPDHELYYFKRLE